MKNETFKKLSYNFLKSLNKEQEPLKPKNKKSKPMKLDI